VGIFYPNQLFRPGSRVVVVKQRRVVSRSWFILSVCPLDWGWKPEDRLTEAPIRLQNSFQNMDVNWSPRSETMSEGSPWRRKMCWRTSSAVSLTEGSLERGMKWAILVKQSTTVRIAVWPLDVGRPVTKSREMYDHGL